MICVCGVHEEHQRSARNSTCTSHWVRECANEWACMSAKRREFVGRWVHGWLTLMNVRACLVVFVTDWVWWVCVHVSKARRVRGSLRSWVVEFDECGCMSRCARGSLRSGMIGFDECAGMLVKRQEFVSDYVRAWLSLMSVRACLIPF